jgi:hypothetical protein
MSAFQRNKFQPVWRCIEKDMAVLILVVGASRKSETVSLNFFVPFLVSPKHGLHDFPQAGSFLHAGQQLFSRPAAPPRHLAPTGQHGHHMGITWTATCSFSKHTPRLDSSWTATCSIFCTWTACLAAPAKTAWAAPISTPDCTCPP